jgi:hypothetical protein
MLLKHNASFYSSQNLQTEHFMNPHAAMRLVAIVSVPILLITKTSALAQPPVRQRAVDVFSLHDGTRLLGVSQNGTQPKSQPLLMNANWLNQEYPILYQQLTTSAEEPSDANSKLVDQLRRHLEQLRTMSPAEIERIGFLQERLTDLEAAAKKQTTYDLILVELSEALIRRQLVQKPAVRKIGELALLNSIPDMETLSVADATSALQRLVAESKLVTALPDSAQLPADHEFQRLLIAAERRFGQPCRLIHYGGNYLSANGEAPDLQALMPQMLHGQIQNQLKNLLGDPSVKPAMIEVANADGVLAPAAAKLAGNRRLVEVSHMDLDLDSGSSTVSIGVYFRSSEIDDFRLFTSVSGNASSAEISPEQLRRINDDPRVRQVTQLFRSLGTGAADLTKAVSMGAVVEVAQNRAGSALESRFSNAPDNSSGLKILRVSLTNLPDSK